MSIKNNIESLLFISPKPLSVKELSKFVSAGIEETKNALAELEQEYQHRQGGLKFLKIEDKCQLATAPECSEVVAKFIKNELTGELTRPSLEALTIIAYRGPVSKAELELIRGVNCGLILRNLLIRGLIEAREDKARLTTVYSITFDFLKYLGLSQVSELPDYEKLNRHNNLDKLLSSLGQSAPAETAVSENIA